MPSLCIRRLSALSLSLFSSIAMAIEEPAYEVLRSDGPFEIRRYAPMLVAETWADGDMDEASNKGFRLIANFIFGNNQRHDSDQAAKIAMTAPVTVEPQPTAMANAAPMTVEPQSAEAGLATVQRWRIHFVMPRAYTLASIPKPRNEAIQLREIPAKVFAVHRYSWLNTQGRVQEKIQETLQWTQRSSLQVIGSPQLARYDPPWTLPMFKRNEIMVEISAP
jgi:hypothetical protein